MTGQPRDELASAYDTARRVVDDLRRELAAVGESTDAGPDDEHDAEGSTVGFERARVTALLDAAERSLARLEGAIERCREGRYGRCAACDDEIATERLHALPGTDRCGKCARIHAARPALRRT
ncbi:MAG TPA: TraR/DksA C4-type zinc finger protein [Acidimicrobiales bacterium]|nr:TraR/DksA C4-type zinc finger protein [Acidimicrobiales bacterium]